MPVNQNDVTRVTLEWNMGFSGIAQCVFYWKLNSAAGLTDVQALDQFEAWANAYADEWQLNAADTTSLSSVQVSVKNLLNEYLSIGERMINRPGGSNQDLLPQGCAGLYRMPVTNSKGQGRKFVPAFVEGSQSEGLWGVVPLLSLAVLASLTVDDPIVIPGVISSWTGGVDVKGGFGMKEFTGDTITNVIVAYQRRRKAGVGV